MQSLADLAADIYCRRRDKAQRAIAAGTIGREAAERHLRPWAAIALQLGADLAEFRGEIAVMRDPAGIKAGRPPSEHACRISIADDLCARAEWAPLLAAARDRAFDRLRDQPGESSKRDARELEAVAAALRFDPNGRHHVAFYGAPASRERPT